MLVKICLDTDSLPNFLCNPSKRPPTTNKNASHQQSPGNTSQPKWSKFVLTQKTLTHLVTRLSADKLTPAGYSGPKPFRIRTIMTYWFAFAIQAEISGASSQQYPKKSHRQNHESESLTISYFYWLAAFLLPQSPKRASGCESSGRNKIRANLIHLNQKHLQILWGAPPKNLHGKQ